MSTQQAQVTTFTIQEKTKQSAGLKSVVNKYLFHWPLFVVGLLLTMTLAVIYNFVTKPAYQVKAELLIKEEKKPQDQQPGTYEIEALNSSKDIQNEIEIISSKQLIGQVAKDLQLWVAYKKKNGLFYDDLYKSGPVRFTLLNQTGNFNNSSFIIIIKDRSSFLMMMSDGKSKEFKFKNSYKNSWGTWELYPTDSLNKFKGETIKVILSDPEKSALQYQKAIDVSIPNKLGTAIDLSINDQVPQRGQDILNRLIFDYNLADNLEKRRETKSTLDFLDQRLDSLAGELATAEKGIETFKSNRGLTDIASESQIRLENVQANDAKLNTVNVQLSIIEGVEKYMESPQGAAKAPASVGIIDPALSILVNKLEQLQLQHDQLSATTPEGNAVVFGPINKQIVTTRADIKETIKNIKSSLITTRDKLESYNTSFTSSIKNIPAEERQYVSIKRQQSIKESLYTYLLQKREETAVSYASTLTDDRVIDHAYVSPASGLHGTSSYALAIIFGISLPIVIIYGRSRLNNYIINLKEIKEYVEIPVIAELPFEKSKDVIRINDHSINATTEQFRTLRTKLNHFYGDKEQGRVTLITSSVPGEGKSFISSNLGVALAYTDRKVVILELDMRKPKIAEIFGLSKEHTGISDFIKGNAIESEIIRESGLDPNLQIITCGSTVHNPTELLEKKNLKDLVLSLRKTYDDIILDTAPVHLVPDAMILAGLADMTLYIIRQGFTLRSELDFLNDLCKQNELPNINLVFNGIERVKYGYGYNYTKPYNNKRNNIFSSVFGDFSNRF